MPKGYLQQHLTFTDDAIYDSDGKAIMMDWETSWMEDTAKIICKKGGNILNIGHGMGIVDNFIQSHSPNTHTIIEPHIDVLDQMKKNGWFSIPNVRVLQSKWQDCINNIGPFDGIYIDTWGPQNDQSLITHLIPSLHRLLKVGGVFSWWWSKNTKPKGINNILNPEYFSIEYKTIKIPSKKPGVVKESYYIDPQLDEVLLPIITKKKKLKLSII